MQNIHLLSKPSTRLKSLSRLNGPEGSRLPSWLENVQILDPGSDLVTKWNSIFLVSCMMILFLDPLYFFVPTSCGLACFGPNLSLAVLITFLRVVGDASYLFHILTKFRTTYVNPNSRVFGKGKLVMNPSLIAKPYLKSDFVIDVAAMLPLPQILIWFVGPAINNKSTTTSHALYTIILLQYIPRMLVMFPLNRKIVNTTGVIARNAWSGAAYNMLLFVLTSHVLGCTWYLWSIQRMQTCWSTECHKEPGFCKDSYFDKSTLNDLDRETWLNRTHVLVNCDPANDQLEFKFGMFADFSMMSCLQLLSSNPTFIAFGEELGVYVRMGKAYKQAHTLLRRYFAVSYV